MIIDFPEIKEIDINPLMVSSDQVYAVDVRIILDQEAARRGTEPYSNLVIMPYPTKYAVPHALPEQDSGGYSD